MRIGSFRWIARSESHSRGVGKGAGGASTRATRRATRGRPGTIADPDSTPLKAAGQDSRNSIRTCGTAVGRSTRGYWGMALPPLPRQALVCDSGSKPAGPARCILHIPRFNSMKREKGGVPGLTRLNPTKALALRGTTPAGPRGPSLFATLGALLGRAAPPPGGGATLPLVAGLGRGERTKASLRALHPGVAEHSRRR